MCRQKAAGSVARRGDTSRGGTVAGPGRDYSSRNQRLDPGLRRIFLYKFFRLEAAMRGVCVTVLLCAVLMGPSAAQTRPFVDNAAGFSLSIPTGLEAVTPGRT